MIDRASHTPLPTTETPPLPSPQPRVPRRAKVLLMVAVAAVVSGAAALLSLAGENNVPTAILTAGGAFAAALGLLLTVAHYAGPQ